MNKISITTLGDLVEFQRGYDLPKSEFKEGNIPVISSNGILGYHNIAKVKAPGITVGRSGTVGLPHYINEDFFPHNTSLFIKDFKDNNPRYIYYLLKTLGLSEYGSGSGVPTMNRNHLHPIKVSVHKDTTTQQKIAKILSDLDAKIELNNKINSELEQMAKNLYDYWFVQFDFPDANKKPYKSSGGEMVYNSILKREIPEGWGVKKIKEIAQTGSGGTPLKSRNEFYVNGNIPWINSGEVNAPFIISTKKFITQSGLDNSSAKLFPKGTILMAMYGATAGQVSLIDLEACTNQAICAIIPKDNRLIEYVKFELHQLYEYLVSISTGSARDNLSQDKIKELFIVVPQEDILEKFHKISNSSFEKILNNLKENQKLEQLRDWLLPMLMNGQVKVADSEEMVIEKLGMVAESPADYQLNLTDKDKKIRRKMLATYIINQSLNDASFGKTKFEKLLHLIECHIVRGNYNQRYSVQAAGPYDGGFTKVFWNEVTKAKWFKTEEFGRLKRIMPAENHAKSLVDYGYLSDDLKLMINDFIAEFKSTNYERPEIISTLYAVWNNRIIRNEMITDELLKKDFLEWDTQKERYKDRLDNALLWMRENGIIPNGWGNEIKRAKK